MSERLRRHHVCSHMTPPLISKLGRFESRALFNDGNLSSPIRPIDTPTTKTQPVSPPRRMHTML